MEAFSTAFVKCTLAEKVIVEDVRIVMHAIFGDFGFRECISPVRTIEFNRCEYYSDEEYNNMRQVEEHHFSRLGGTPPTENEPDMLLKSLAEGYTVPDEMKWKCLEDADWAEEAEHGEEVEFGGEHRFLTCFRFRGESAKSSLSPTPSNCYSWMGGEFGFNGVGRHVDAEQFWGLLYPFEFHEVDEVEGENIFAIRTDLYCSWNVSGYERFLLLALHELCFRLHAEMPALETTVVTGEFDKVTGKGIWVDLFGLKEGVPRLQWQARPDMTFVKHRNTDLERELNAYQNLICMMAANDGRLPSGW